jgi:membrane protease YdiL (CAAX protease family)
LLPIAAGYGLIFGWLERSTSLEPNAALLAIKFLLAQGLGEELLFRGFLFRRLRETRGFWAAAALSVASFSFAHLANLVRGFSPEALLAVATSVVFAFLLAFPLAALFELGNGSIVAGAIWHLSVDSVNWFQDAGVPGPPLVIYLASLLVSAAVVMIVAGKAHRPSNH